MDMGQVMSELSLQQAFIFDALILSFVRVTRQFYSKFTTIPQDIFK